MMHSNQGRAGPTLMAATLWVIASVIAQPTHAESKNGPSRWKTAIAAFEKADRERPPAKNAVLFIGSSSIRLWDLKKSFPDLPTINRGFGGSRIADSTHFADRIVIPYRPRAIVLYAGDNDIAGGKSPEQVFADYRDFVVKVRGALPDVPIVFVAIKPSLRRWALYGRMRKTNDLIREFVDKDATQRFLDVATPMLGADGQPRKELFRDDGLHLNAAGYTLWTGLLTPLLKPRRDRDSGAAIPNIRSEPRHGIAQAGETRGRSIGRSTRWRRVGIDGSAALRAGHGFGQEVGNRAAAFRIIVERRKLADFVGNQSPECRVQQLAHEAEIGHDVIVILLRPRLIATKDSPPGAEEHLTVISPVSRMAGSRRSGDPSFGALFAGADRYARRDTQNRHFSYRFRWRVEWRLQDRQAPKDERSVQQTVGPGSGRISGWRRRVACSACEGTWSSGDNRGPFRRRPTRS